MTWEELNKKIDNEDYCVSGKLYNKLLKKIEQLEKQKQKVIALIKDGRFVEALQELENETLA